MQLLKDKDVLSGLMFFLIGAFGLFYALPLEFGSTLRPGPGYFPIVLSSILTLLGFGIALKGVFSRVDPISPIYMRPLILITGGVVTFSLCIIPLGLVPAVFSGVIIASFAKPNFGHLARVSTAAALSAFAVLLFVILLDLPMNILTL